jgi:hypothetical protein
MDKFKKYKSTVNLNYGSFKVKPNFEIQFISISLDFKILSIII